jgi:hypothetical protein
MFHKTGCPQINYFSPRHMWERAARGMGSTIKPTKMDPKRFAPHRPRAFGKNPLVCLWIRQKNGPNSRSDRLDPVLANPNSQFS